MKLAAVSEEQQLSIGTVVVFQRLQVGENAKWTGLILILICFGNHHPTCLVSLLFTKMLVIARYVYDCVSMLVR